MHWQRLERVFDRAARHSWSLTKAGLVFGVLLVCGLMSVICRAISHTAGQWMQMSVAFIPIFVSAALLMGLGILLVRLYYKEVRKQSSSLKEILIHSKSLLASVTYLLVPAIFLYLILWILLGAFYLLRSIPQLGPYLSSILSVGPFLLVLGSLVMGLLALPILFFFTPAVALESSFDRNLALSVFQRVVQAPFFSCVLLLISLLPTLLFSALLVLAALVTNMLYVEASNLWLILFKWLFIMIPFCLCLTPGVIFFFNFAAESSFLLRKSIKST